MRKKQNTSTRASALQITLSIALLSVSAILLAFGSGSAPSKSDASFQLAPRNRTLSFADRVAFQTAIEQVYWRHRIWPKERPDPKPSLEAVMSQAQLENKVEDYLRNSQALEDYWQRPITAQQLQAEMARMAQHTKQPEVLRELFAALGNDPFVIAECLARPALAERLVINLYARDQRFHGELKRQAEAELRAHRGVRQMKHTSGTYREIELIKSDSEDIVGQWHRLPSQDLAGRAPALQRKGSTPGIKLTGSEWDEKVQKLTAMFVTASPSSGGFGDGHPAAAGVSPTQPTSALGGPPQKRLMQIKTGVLSPLQEDNESYYATAMVKKSKDRLKLATVRWRKEPLESWRATVERQMPKVMAATTASYMLPTISDGVNGCTDNTWTATTGLISRSSHTAVWTGSEMIVWGGYDGLNTGARYNPATDSWTTTSTSNAPSGRYQHTAVWTGSEMIVWGGYDGLNTGARYNPATDSWTTTSTSNAPSSRYQHTAVWTGSEMIVWGGFSKDMPLPGNVNTGGRYNPGTNSWTATSTTNAPSARSGHTALWTGSEMIVWGGYDGSYANTGARYNPGTDSWTATSTTSAPSARIYHRALWTGSEMIVWGGYDGSYANTGGRYNPATDSWTTTSTSNAPSARQSHTAVWTGSEMIVWGGDANTGAFFNTGARYNPGTDSWTTTSTSNAPSGRQSHTAVWTGSEMIVWGGDDGYDLNTGGRYNPGTDSWTTTNTTNVPSARSDHTAVWTGSEMIVWGGRDGDAFFNTGARFNPGTDSWITTSTANAPSARLEHTAVWTGREMIVWGGYDGSSDMNTGGRYNPGTDSWITTSISNAPSARALHTAVWTGTEMIVWGGYDGSYVSTGARYNPGTDGWTTTSISNVPPARTFHTAVWTGTEMIVWGGYNSGTFANTGARYSPSSNSWMLTSNSGAPTGRYQHAAVCAGSEMIVWGGYDGSYVSTGARYNPGTDSWTTTSTSNAPSARQSHTAVWTGREMIVWGGYDGSSGVNTGGRYNPGTDSWITTSTSNAPSARAVHTAVWTGSEMIVWGGSDLNTGGRYCAQLQAPVAQNAFSRKIHGSAGTFDIAVPLTGTTGVECRSGGATNDFTMVVTFSGNVTVTGSPQAQVTSGMGTVGSGGVSNGGMVTVAGNTVTIPLTNVADQQTIDVALNGVSSAIDQPSANFMIPMSRLLGDTNGNRVVNATDVGQTKTAIGQFVTSANFRADVNVSGTFNAGDVGLVKANIGHFVP